MICATCGGFYNPSCPQYPACKPGPDNHAVAVAVLIARATSTTIAMNAMITENNHRMTMHRPFAYTQEDFNALADDLNQFTVAIIAGDFEKCFTIITEANENKSLDKQ